MILLPGREQNGSHSARTKYSTVGAVTYGGYMNGDMGCKALLVRTAGQHDLPPSFVRNCGSKYPSRIDSTAPSGWKIQEREEKRWKVITRLYSRSIKQSTRAGWLLFGAKSVQTPRASTRDDQTPHRRRQIDMGRRLLRHTSCSGDQVPVPSPLRRRRQLMAQHGSWVGVAHPQ